MGIFSKPKSDVNEPVIAIAKSFREPNRWKFKTLMLDTHYVTDRNTGIRLMTSCFHHGEWVHVSLINYPDWMTDKEKKYLERELSEWYSEHVEKIKQNKREEVKKLYGVD